MKDKDKDKNQNQNQNQKIILQVSPKDQQIAFLTSIAIFLSLIDAAIPSPIPGVKPGLANIVILIVLNNYGIKEAIWVNFLRVFSAAMVFGYFLSPSFFMSLSGAIFSLIGLYFCQKLLNKKYFSLVSFSIISAFLHMFGQLLLARLWLIPHDGVWLMSPLLFLVAAIFGLVNGIIAEKILE